jgi:hypothetical protein
MHDGIVGHGRVVFLFVHELESLASGGAVVVLNYATSHLDVDVRCDSLPGEYVDCVH